MSFNNRLLNGQPSVAIIGAGLAGLTCASALKGLVSEVTLFEKNIYAGGRISSLQAGEYEFNHGAQFFTVRSPLFWNIVSAWQDEGFVRPWNGWIVELDKGQITNNNIATQRFVGQPRMQTIVEKLSANCHVVTANVSEVEPEEGGGWRLFSERGDYLGAFDIVIIATAAHQVSRLCSGITDITAQADKVSMTTCWSGMFAFEDRIDLPFDAAYVLDSPLSWISRHQNSEQSGEADCWVLHASPEWSQQYAASFRGRVMHAMLDAFWQATDLNEVIPVASAVHCWKHAAPINPIQQDSLFVESKTIGACGDWCTSPRVEGAVLSGFSMADRVMKFIHKSKI